MSFGLRDDYPIRGLVLASRYYFLTKALGRVDGVGSRHTIGG